MLTYCDLTKRDNVNLDYTKFSRHFQNEGKFQLATTSVKACNKTSKHDN